jgi:phosphoribosylformylglycinamidine (FGAM) synthase PurS component
MTVEVLVKLRAHDPWSFTVLDALGRKFGIEAVIGVDRLKSWRLDFHPDSEDRALMLASRILEETALLANPNRDVWTVNSQSGVRLPGALSAAVAGGDRFFAVRVADREDFVGRQMLTVLWRRLGMSEIRGVGYSLMWILEFDRSGEEALRLAEEVAVARSWRKGLLANPHCQEATVSALPGLLCAEGGAL